MTDNLNTVTPANFNDFYSDLRHPQQVSEENQDAPGLSVRIEIHFRQESQMYMESTGNSLSRQMDSLRATIMNQQGNRVFTTLQKTVRIIIVV